MEQERRAALLEKVAAFYGIRNSMNRKRCPSVKFAKASFLCVRNCLISRTDWTEFLMQVSQHSPAVITLLSETKMTTSLAIVFSRSCGVMAKESPSGVDIVAPATRLAAARRSSRSFFGISILNI